MQTKRSLKIYRSLSLAMFFTFGFIPDKKENIKNEADGKQGVFYRITYHSNSREESITLKVHVNT